MTHMFDQQGGRLAENIMHFARVLRRTGLPVGPGAVIEAIKAVECAGFSRRADFYWTLHSVFVTRRDQRELFDQAFHVFWRKPEFLEQMMAMLMPELARTADDKRPDPGRTRLANALFDDREMPERDLEREPNIEIDATMTFSDREVLRKMDFEQMTAEEEVRARAAIARMRLARPHVATRRFRPDDHGRRVDMRATMRASLRAGGEIAMLRRKERARRAPPLVVLCDISGSMSGYSRMFLHFLHAVTNDGDRVSSFLFGTRLTNITRYLRTRDVDDAVAKVSDAIEDWSGGTRIGSCLHEFNRHWSRRVLGQGAHVLLITDGLDRELDGRLEVEMARLHRSCKRLVWLNPLLRFDGFQAKASGIRAMLPHVDEFRPVHNLESLEALIEALGDLTPGSGDPAQWLRAVA